MIRDVGGRLHDALGRFARTGKLVVRAQEPGGRAGDRPFQSQRAAGAFKPPTPAAERRTRKARITSAARRISDLTRRDPKTLTFSEREDISFASPKLRDEARARTGDVLMPRTEALRREVGIARMGQRPAPRVAISKTFTGRWKPKRALAPQLGAQITSAGRGLVARHPHLMADFPIPPTRRRAADMFSAAAGVASPTTPASNPAPAVSREVREHLDRLAGRSATDIRKSLTLATDARMRELLTAVGADLPAKRGSKALVDAVVAALTR